MKDLDVLLKAVNDKKTFLEFAKALGADKKDEEEKEKTSPSKPYGPGANGWENTSVDHFLDSCAAWAEDHQGWSDRADKGPTWKLFAEFLYAGKYYE